jgi:hypothetical protein
LLDKSEIPFNPPSPHSERVPNKGKKNKLNYLASLKNLRWKDDYGGVSYSRFIPSITRMNLFAFINEDDIYN